MEWNMLCIAVIKLTVSGLSTTCLMASEAFSTVVLPLNDARSTLGSQSHYPNLLRSSEATTERTSVAQWHCIWPHPGRCCGCVCCYRFCFLGRKSNTVNSLS